MAKNKKATTPSDPTAAEILDSFEFKEFGGKGEYPWAQWLDGQIRKLMAGVNYSCKDSTLLTLARSAAKKQGMIVKTGKVEGGVVIQAVKASEEQKAKWEEAEAKKEAEEQESEE